MLRVLVALLASAILTAPARSQVPPSPLHEVRAVWISTAFQLDWPPRTTYPAEQEEALRAMIQDAHNLGLNTIFFQAVARGDAMYRSQRLPWSPFLTGSPGNDPGWDPLAVAVDETRRLGMELHAWVNVYLVGHQSAVPKASSSNPPHISYSRPDWIQVEAANEWLDPALPDARRWLVENMTELVENYDVDGIHFDFIRYPQGGFASDRATQRSVNRLGIADIGDWRRHNITEFVREAHAAIKRIKPWLKVGSAPLGQYRMDPQAPPALWAYSDVFQESRKWLEEGVHDYLVPQIYFSIGNAPEPGRRHSSPDFIATLEGWATDSAGRHVYAGMGVYKETIHREIASQIDASRASGAVGHAFFRYEHLKTTDLDQRFERPALIPSMPWLEPGAPRLADGLRKDRDPVTGLGRLTWSPAEADERDSLKGYAIFRSAGSTPDVSNSEHLWRIVGPDSTAVTFESPPPVSESGRMIHQYAVVAISRLGAQSAPIYLISGNPSSP